MSDEIEALKVTIIIIIIQDFDTNLVYELPCSYKLYASTCNKLDQKIPVDLKLARALS